MSKFLKQQNQIIDGAEKFFIEKGFLKFQILEFSNYLNIEAKIINDFFITKGGLLLSILSQLYVDLFALDCSWKENNPSLNLKREIFKQVNFSHARKIDLFISFFERKELSHLDAYLLKLFCKTMGLHFKIFLMQLSSEEYNCLKTGKAKYFYFIFFEKYKTKRLETG